jgi:hypothetical protein
VLSGPQRVSRGSGLAEFPSIRSRTIGFLPFAALMRRTVLFEVAN